MAALKARLAIAAGLVALVVVVSLPSLGGPTKPAKGDPPEPPPFAVLTEGEEAPLGLVDLAPSDWITLYGLELEEATSAETPSSAIEVAVVPGSEGVCILTETAGGCASWVEAELGQLVLVEACSPGLDPGEVRVTGLVPDDASTAVITRPPAAGVNVSAPLNVFATTFSGDPDELTSSGLSIPVELAWDEGDESLTTCEVPESEDLVESDPE